MTAGGKHRRSSHIEIVNIVYPAIAINHPLGGIPRHSRRADIMGIAIETFKLASLQEIAVFLG
jgi:hypothetical protein